MKLDLKRFIISVIIAISFSIFIISQLLDTFDSTLKWVIFFTLTVALSFPVLHSYFIPPILTWLNNKNIKFVILTLFTTIILGFVLINLIPLRIFPKVLTLELSATGNKNNSSKGNEVWLEQIISGRTSSSIPIANKCSGNWEQIDGFLVATTPETGILSCQIKVDKEIKLLMGVHQWSGEVEVSINSISRVFDLYSSIGTEKVLTVEFPVSDKEKIFSSAFFIFDGITFGFFILFVSTFLLSSSQLPKSKNANLTKYQWLIYGTVIITFWVLVWIIYWPGFLSPDGVTQLSQVVSGRYYNWHPAFHTFTLWLLTRISLSPAPVVGFQILVLGMILGKGISILFGSNTSQRKPWVLTFFFAFFPPIALLVLTIWKDVAYSIALVTFTIMIFQIVLSNGSWLNKYKNWVGLGLIAGLSMLFRHNGWIAIVGTLAFLIFAYSKTFIKSIIFASILTVIVYWGVTGPIYSLLRVNTTDLFAGKNQGIQYALSSLIASHKVEGTIFTREETDFISKANIGGEELNREYVNDKQIDLGLIAARLTFRRPIVTFHFFLTKTAFIFQIQQPPLSRYETIGGDIVDNPFGIKPTVFFPKIKSLLNNFIRWTELPEVDWFFWRNAFWMYLLIYSSIIASIKAKNWKFLLVILPVVLNALPLAIFTGGQLSRYIFPTLICSPLLIFYFLSYQPEYEEDEVK